MDYSTMNSYSTLNKKLESLDNRQLQIINKFTNGDNIFLSGPAGTGKSHIINIINDICDITNIKSHTTALTGCAALLLTNAKTLHSWSGIVINNYDVEYNVNKIRKNKGKRNNWLKVNTLIIDEVSMMSDKLFDLLDGVGRYLRKVDKPFGGIQLILSGDFFQLPPIGDCKFCFESNEWDNIFPNINILKKIYRQDDPEFTKILNKVRTGKVKSKSLVKLLQTRLIKYKGNIIPTIILPNRLNVNNINARNHLKLDGKGSKIFKIKINRPPPDKTIVNKYEIDNGIEQFIKSNIYSPELELKIGDQVICNRNISDKIVNGSRGVIISISQYPVVNFLGGEVVTMMPFDIQHESIVGLSFSQIPLNYAWALTIHKCQGMSLDICKMDLGSNVFEYGQTYVALSRVKKLDGLYLMRLNVNKIKANPRVKKYYKDRRLPNVKCSKEDKLIEKTEVIKNIIEWCKVKKEEVIPEIHIPVRKKNVWVDEEDTFLLRNRNESNYSLYKLYLKENFCETKTRVNINNRLKSLLNKEKQLFKKLELEKIPINTILQGKLSEFRYAAAKKELKPPYYIMNNDTLDTISRKFPKNVDELLEIKGIGKTFIEKYSVDILKLTSEPLEM